MFDVMITELLRGNQVSFVIKKCLPIRFTKIEMLAPNKVMRFTFNTGGVVKTVCKEA